MTIPRAVSADSHVVEPFDLWTERIDRAFLDRAPHVEARDDGVNCFYMEGRRPQPIRPLGTPFAMWGKQEEEGRRGGWDPAARIEDMAIDGILAEVLYPSMALVIFGMEDPALQAACFRAYNNWLADFCAGSPKRLHGVALIPMYDAAVAVAELKRTAAMGLRGAAIWGTPPTELNFETDHHEPFFAEAEAMGVPISLHCFTGGSHRRWDHKSFCAPYALSRHMIQESITYLVFDKVFERYPGLTVISVENDIGWVPYMKQRMDYVYTGKGPRYNEFFDSGMLPSEIFERNVKCTFMSDPVGTKVADLIGPDVLMWSTDYPHDDSTWPNSQDVVEREFAHVAPDLKDRAIYRNCVDLYDLDLEGVSL